MAVRHLPNSAIGQAGRTIKPGRLSRIYAKKFFRRSGCTGFDLGFLRSCQKTEKTPYLGVPEQKTKIILGRLRWVFHPQVPMHSLQLKKLNKAW